VQSKDEETGEDDLPAAAAGQLSVSKAARKQHKHHGN